MNSTSIQSLVNRIQGWFFQAQQKAADASEAVCEIPEVTRKRLAQKLDKLPTPSPYQQKVQTACADAIARWQDSSEAENSLVVMAEPVVPIHRILTDALAEMHLEDLDIQHPLAEYHRPADPLNISAELFNALESLQRATAKTDDTDDDVSSSPSSENTDRRQVIVIPALEQCFLRCIQGWKSIEDLQRLIVQDRSRFWVIGCSSWAWVFLDRVCQIGAYLEQFCPLPDLTDDDLRDWLAPLSQQAVLVANSSNSSDQSDQTDVGNLDSYWNSLKNLSEGTSSIAAQLWLRSVGIQEENLPDDEKASLAPEDLSLCLRKPVLPSLPTLIQTDRYLLHCLLIHGALPQIQLAISLGESETQVRSRVQILLRAGILLKQQGQFTINPIHFSRLRNELSSNNFLIGKVPS